MRYGPLELPRDLARPGKWREVGRILLNFKSFGGCSWKEMGFGPFFVSAHSVRRKVMAALEALVEPVVAGMGYELVDLQASNGGRLLRLFIDKPGGIGSRIARAVSRQLTRVFAVEGVDYERLEVSSPGLDRPLRKAGGFRALRRAEGRREDAHAGASGRRQFVGVLRGAEDGRRRRWKWKGRTVRLALDDIERARLVPEL